MNYKCCTSKVSVSSFWGKVMSFVKSGTSKPNTGSLAKRSADAQNITVHVLTVYAKWTTTYLDWVISLDDMFQLGSRQLQTSWLSYASLQNQQFLDTFRIGAVGSHYQNTAHYPTPSAHSQSNSYCC